MKESTGLRFELCGEGYAVTGIGSCTDADIVIPSVNMGKPVVMISDGAFESCGSLETVTIPDSVKTVGESSFESCTSLTCVFVGKGMRRIGPFAFYDCPSLTDVVYAGRVKDWERVLVDAGNNLFRHAHKTSTADSAEITYDYYLEYDPDIEDVEEFELYYSLGLLKGADEDDESAAVAEIPADINPGRHRYPHGFGDNWGFVESLSDKRPYSDALSFNFRANYDPETDAFGVHATDGLRYKELSNGYMVTGKGKNRDEFLRIPSIYKDRPVIAIDEHAFRNRTEIRHVIVPDTVIFIGEGAFAGCGAIEDMSLPFVGGYITQGPDKRTLFGYIFGEIDESEDDNSAWQCCAPGYHDGADDIKESLKKSDMEGEEIDLSDYCGLFYMPNELRTVIIRGGQIYNGAFENCSSIEKIVLPESTTVIGDCAFFYCYGITHIDIPENVTSIGICAFYRCCLEEIKLSENVKIIGGLAFNRNDVMTTADIPGVRHIGRFAFSGCFDLERVRLSKNLVSLDEYAFRLTDLYEVILPKSVKQIGKDLFYDCDRFKRIFYEGTVSSWERIIIDRENAVLRSADVYFLSERKPTAKGKFWHYDAEGNPVIWREK